MIAAASHSPAMRILLTADPILPVPPVRYGGIERIVDALVREYRARGHTVGLLALAESTSPADVKFAWPSRHPCSTLGGCRNALALRRAARELGADVVHSFSRLGYLLPLLRSSRPKVMSYQRHTGGRPVAWAARLGGRSLEFTGCSEFICEMGRAAGGRWTAIPNFVETDRIRFSPQVPPDAPLVFLSRIESIKGPDLAIDIARASGRRLILAGNRPEAGPERDFWERAIAPRLGRDGVEWIGEVDDAGKDRLLGGAAALVLPIRWNEPFGIVFPEAMAAGTPVIACPRGAVPDIVEHGVTGFLISSVEEGVEAVRRLPELARRDCRRAAETRFNLPACAGRYLDLYGGMMGR